MHLHYFFAAATMLTAVSAFPHFWAGRRQLDGYEIVKTSSSEVFEPYTIFKSHTHRTKPSTRFSGLSGGASSFSTRTSYPTGISASATGTGTGGSAQITTSSLAPYANASSILPPTTPGSTGGISYPSSGLPISAIPTGKFPTGLPSPISGLPFSAIPTGVFPTGLLPPISGLPTVTAPHHTPIFPHPEHTTPLPFHTGIPYGPLPIIHQSASSGTGCAPPATVTYYSTIKVTTTVTASTSSTPIVSALPVSTLAPYPVPGNSTLGYPTTGGTGIGTGTGLLIGTGTGIVVYPTFSTTSSSVSSSGSSSSVSISASASASVASLQPYT